MKPSCNSTKSNNAIDMASEKYSTNDEHARVASDATTCLNHELLENNAIQTWLLNLSKECLFEAMIIRDEHFMSTILDLHSTSLTLRSHFPEEESTRAEKMDLLLIPLEEAESIYLRFANTTNNIGVSTTPCVGANDESSGSIDENTSPTFPLDTMNPRIFSASPTTEVLRNDKTTGNTQILTSTPRCDESTDNVRNDYKEDSDMFRIQDESYRIPSLAVHTNLVFPSVINFILKQRGSSPSSYTTGNLPCITFDVSNINVDALSNRLHRCLQEYENSPWSSLESFWVCWLRQRFCNEHKVSISDLLLARAEVALVATYKDQMTSSVQHGNVEVTCSKDASVDDSVCPSFDTKNPDKPTSTQHAVPRAPIPVSSLNPHGHEPVDNIKSILKDIVAFSQELRHFAKQDDLDKLKSVCPGIVSTKDQLPFVPLMELIKASDAEKNVLNQTVDLNQMLETVLTSIMSRAEQAGFQSSVATTLINSNPVEQPTHVSMNGASTKKKKKKPKKRKNTRIEKPSSHAKIIEPSRVLPVQTNNAPTEMEVSPVMHKSVTGHVEAFSHVNDAETQALFIEESSEPSFPSDNSTRQLTPSMHPLVPNLDKTEKTASTNSDNASNNSDILEDSSLLVESTLDMLILNPQSNCPTEEPVHNNDEVTEKIVNPEEEIWETVEAKARGKSRRHSDPKPGSAGSGAFSGNRKNKNARIAMTRKHNQNRKIVKDILVTVLEAVEDELDKRERKPIPSNHIADERRQKGEKVGNSFLPERRLDLIAKSAANTKAKPATLRDIVLRQQIVNPMNSVSNSNRPANIDGTLRCTKDINNAGHLSPKAPPFKHQMNSLADQNTANTVPETLSGTSANTQSSLNTDSENTAFEAYKQSRSAVEAPITGDSSSDYIDEGNWQKPAPVVEKEGCPSPPLQTLLGPGNTNSATSSVASSLDAPHGGNHRHHHHCSAGNENDVGYHLLDVCDRLSRDMDVFMTRRADALTVRRKERGALLAALQDTANNIWGGRAHVEMYGSCATQLDLPSSDLDAVIRGLDTSEVVMTYTQQALRTPNTSPPRNKQTRRIPLGVNHDEIDYHNEALRHEAHMQMSPYTRLTMTSMNGERVMRLAAELERQPWAVQVKAIPTASVPVIKILADPSRLPGILVRRERGDWMMQKHPISSQNPAMSVVEPPRSSNEKLQVPANGDSIGNSQSQYQQHSHPWRGADIMNGLFSIDITFEGPEHGGIGSTAFSARVVQDACTETGLPPERTPAVQVLMVLKELLAQRRLNEPFSGGLSSYALLLLLVAVMKERNAIREEMERIERHRRGLCNGTVLSTSDQINSRGKPAKTDHNSNKHGEERLQDMREHEINSTLKECARFVSMGTPRANSSGMSDVEVNNRGRHPSKEVNAIQSTIRNMTASSDPTKKESDLQATKGGGSSWASIARKSTLCGPVPTQRAAEPPSTANATMTTPKAMKRINSFAEAVSGKQTAPSIQVPKPVVMSEAPAMQPNGSKRCDKPNLSSASKAKAGSASKVSHKQESQTRLYTKAPDTQQRQTRSPALEVPVLPQIDSVNETTQLNTSTSNGSLSAAFSMFPQGSNDVLEVLCSGQTTAGKLLMHFLLFYGRYFDARTTAIEVCGKYDSVLHMPYLSPFIPRRSGGNIDPHTGMLTVDPIVIFDPWEGADNNNVTRSCFAWSSIRWHFAQCYMTLSSAVDRSGTPTTSDSSTAPVPKTERTSENEVLTPLLELLLSF